MVNAGWTRYTPHALVAAVVFEFMHIADELAGSWAPFRPMNEPMVATFSMGVFTLVGMLALWRTLTGRAWGYGLAALFGLFFLLAEIWHLLDPANMTVFRWVVVVLAQVSGAAVLILGTIGLRERKPWQRAEKR